MTKTQANTRPNTNPSPSPSMNMNVNQTQSSIITKSGKILDPQQMHVCRLCDKLLSSSSSLDRHMLTHSGERPFVCKRCHMTFTTNGNMHRHMRTHLHKDSLARQQQEQMQLKQSLLAGGGAQQSLMGANATPQQQQSDLTASPNGFYMVPPTAASAAAAANQSRLALGGPLASLIANQQLLAAALQQQQQQQQQPAALSANLRGHQLGVTSQNQNQNQGNQQEVSTTTTTFNQQQAPPLSDISTSTAQLLQNHQQLAPAADNQIMQPHNLQNHLADHLDPKTALMMSAALAAANQRQDPQASLESVKAVMLAAAAAAAAAAMANQQQQKDLGGAQFGSNSSSGLLMEVPGMQQQQHLAADPSHQSSSSDLEQGPGSSGRVRGKRRKQVNPLRAHRQLDDGGLLPRSSSVSSPSLGGLSEEATDDQKPEARPMKKEQIRAQSPGDFNNNNNPGPTVSGDSSGQMEAVNVTQEFARASDAVAYSAGTDNPADHEQRGQLQVQVKHEVEEQHRQSVAAAREGETDADFSERQTSKQDYTQEDPDSPEHEGERGQEEDNNNNNNNNEDQGHKTMENNHLSSRNKMTVGINTSLRHLDDLDPDHDEDQNRAQGGQLDYTATTNNNNATMRDSFDPDQSSSSRASSSSSSSSSNEDNPRRQSSSFVSSSQEVLDDMMINSDDEDEYIDEQQQQPKDLNNKLQTAPPITTTLTNGLLAATGGSQTSDDLAGSMDVAHQETGDDDDEIIEDISQSYVKTANPNATRKGGKRNRHCYKCKLCTYSSVDRCTLVRHLRIHSGERPYICGICRYAFTTKANCERHVRKRHKKQYNSLGGSGGVKGSNGGGRSLIITDHSNHQTIPVKVNPVAAQTISQTLQRIQEKELHQQGASEGIMLLNNTDNLQQQLQRRPLENDNIERINGRNDLSGNGASGNRCSSTFGKRKHRPDHDPLSDSQEPMSANQRRRLTGKQHKASSGLDAGHNSFVNHQLPGAHSILTTKNLFGCDSNSLGPLAGKQLPTPGSDFFLDQAAIQASASNFTGTPSGPTDADLANNNSNNQTNELFVNLLAQIQQMTSNNNSEGSQSSQHNAALHTTQTPTETPPADCVVPSVSGANFLANMLAAGKAAMAPSESDTIAQQPQQQQQPNTLAEQLNSLLSSKHLSQQFSQFRNLNLQNPFFNRRNPFEGPFSSLDFVQALDLSCKLQTHK